MKITVSRLYGMLSTVSRRCEDCSFEDYAKNFTEPLGDLLDCRVDVPVELIDKLYKMYSDVPAAK